MVVFMSYIHNSYQRIVFGFKKQVTRLLRIHLGSDEMAHWVKIQLKFHPQDPYDRRREPIPVSYPRTPHTLNVYMHKNSIKCNF